MTAPEKKPGRLKDAAPAMMSMTLAAGALFLIVRAFLSAPCWSLLFLSALIAWPIWRYQKEFTQFQRRAILASLTVEDGWVRRWFWSGHISGAMHAVVALFWATLLIAFGTLLRPEQWLVIAVDVLVLAMVIGPVQSRLASQVRGERLGLVARRWPLFWINVAVLAIGFFVLDFFIVGAPDTRGLAWNDVAQKAFLEVSATAACPLAGWLVGAIAALDRLSWHASEVLIPSLPNQMLKLVAWGIFLLQAGILSFAFTRLELGVVSMVEGRTLRLSALTGASTASKAFFLTILALAVPYMYASFKLQDFDPTALANRARRAVTWANPCHPDTQALDALKTGLTAELDSARATAKKHANVRIDNTLTPLFSEVERGVDSYLDWYFSVVGEYQRLGAQAIASFPALMTAKLEEHLFGNTRFNDRLEKASRDIAAESAAQMSALATRLGTRVESDVRDHPCWLDALNLGAPGTFKRDLLRATAAMGVGGLTGGAVTTMLLVKKTTAAVASKLASKKLFKLSATLAGKAVAKRGGSILLSAAGATALCSAAGPLAIACGIVGGVVVWLTVDEALIKIDEIRFRAEMRAEILESVLGQKAELANDLRVLHHAAIDQMALETRKAVDGAFIPARDGI